MKVFALMIAALAVIVGCSSDGQNTATPTTDRDSTTTVAEPTTSTAATAPTTVEEPPEQPPLTHAQFVKRLDRICKRGNRQYERFNKRIDAAFAREDYDEAARIWARSNKRLNPPFYKAVRALEPPPEDERGLGRYLALSNQIDVLEVRYIRALRQLDEDEMDRLTGLINRVVNNRTLVTSRMGLTECGG